MVSERSRRREVHRLFPPALRGVDLTTILKAENVPLPPQGFQPRASPDDTLTLFCQSVVQKLGVARAFISLLDGEYQYILAEASASSRLGERRQENDSNSIWLGNVCIPRERGFCRAALAIKQRLSPLVIPDLGVDDGLKDAWCVIGHPFWRFYAAYPLYGEKDAIVGDICVFDTEPWPQGLTHEQIEFFDGISGVVTRYLAGLRTDRQQVRSDRMIQGLLNFNDSNSNHMQEMKETLGTIDSSREARNIDPSNLIKSAPGTAPSSHDLGKNLHHNAPKGRDGSFQHQRRQTYMRAARILREACELDGVAFVEASQAAVGLDRLPPQQKYNIFQASDPSHIGVRRDLKAAHPSSTDIPLNQADDLSTSDTGSECGLLALSHARKIPHEQDTLGTLPTLCSPLMLRMIISKYTEGQAFEIVLDDLEFPDALADNSGDDERTIVFLPSATDKSGVFDDFLTSLSATISKLSPSVRQIFILPLWNYDHSRWCTCGLFWTEQAAMPAFDRSDRIYFKSFGNSIMAELSRLHMLEVGKMKTSFVASISHELRTPLHGLLGATDLLKSSVTNPFQSSMLDIVQSSGNTLLDILDHILDYSRINGRKQGDAHSVARQNTGRRTSRTSTESATPNEALAGRSIVDCNIVQVTEQVVESIFAGQIGRQETASGLPNQLPGTAPRTNDITDPTSRMQSDPEDKNPIRVILRIDPSCHANVRLSVGGWRRVIMNLFGNALKYTHAGYVLISLAYDITSHTLQLRIEDTGVGMSEKFLTESVGSAFTQENSFAPGLGLGLHITRQLIESLGGNMKIQSTKGVGTRVSVDLRLPHSSSLIPIPASAAMFSRIKDRMRGKVCYLAGYTEISQTGGSSDGATIDSLVNDTIDRLMRNWFGVPVVHTSIRNETIPDIVFCGLMATDKLHQTISEHRMQNPRTIFIASASDAMRAAALQEEARSTMSVVNLAVISQPSGPFKIAAALTTCLDRYDTLPHMDVSMIRNQQVVQKRVHDTDAGQSNGTSVSPHAMTDTSMSGVPTSEASLESLESSIATHIMIVDDNKINRSLLTALMRKHDLPYEEAVHGLQALEIYQASPQRWRIILMDMTMPVMNGFVSTQKIRAHEKEHNLPRVQIVAVTGLADNTSREEAIYCGVDEFLTKPVRFKDLLEML